MTTPIAPPPRPALSELGLDRSPWHHAMLVSMWAWPLVLSLLFVGGVMFWLRSVEISEREAQRAAMITDALSLESQLSNRIEAEGARLKSLADIIGAGRVDGHSFAENALVLDGLRRFWVSVTWIDASGRIVAQVPDDTLPANSATRSGGDDGGLSGHLSAAVAGKNGKPTGILVARYSAVAVLRQKVPWWLARKYEVRLVDELGEIIASTSEGARQKDLAWYRVALGPSLPQAFLELTAREQIQPWWRSMPVALMAGFVGLLSVASWMLRRQMRIVSRAESAWRTEVAWRSAMEDSLAVGIRARDLQGRLVYVNKTLGDMVGYKPEELVGLMPPMPYWVPDDLDQIMRRHQRMMAGQAIRGGYESRWLHRDGHVVDVMVYEAPLVDATGKHIGWMASIIDVTERKRLEDRERKQVEAMAHHARLTMLGEVASTLAHELNQPLSVIISYNTGLLNAMQRRHETDPQLLGALQRMGEQAAHAGRIVKRIREFLTRHEPQLEACDLNPVVESAVALLKRDFARQQVDLIWALDPALPKVVIDPVLIEQVVVNLVRNGCDALSGFIGQRRITVSTSLAMGDKFVKVSVSDNGPGLGGKCVEELCEPFFSTKDEGMGMGLAICRSIIELHYGAFDAEDMPGGGACFSFTVPREGCEDESEGEE